MFKKQESDIYGCDAVNCTFFFLTLVTCPRRSLSLKLSDKRVYAPQIRARLGTRLTLGGMFKKQESDIYGCDAVNCTFPSGTGNETSVTNPQIRTPKPETQHPKPELRNPKPENRILSVNCTFPAGTANETSVRRRFNLPSS